jgi:hypothetical protein
MEQILLFLAPVIEAYSGKLGGALQVIAIIGSLRLIIKPLMGLIEAYVAITPTKNDDLLPAKIMESKAYKSIIYILDWFASLKLPKK